MKSHVIGETKLILRYRAELIESKLVKCVNRRRPSQSVAVETIKRRFSNDQNQVQRCHSTVCKCDLNYMKQKKQNCM